MRKVLTRVLVAALCLAAAAACAAEPFFSEYVEGSSNNKAIEIYNPGPAVVNLTGYEIREYFNGSTTPTIIVLNGVNVAAGDVYVVVHSLATPVLLALGDQVTGSLSFNGDDAITLTKNAGAMLLDAFGQVGVDPGTQWGAGLTSSLDHTLRRRTGPDTVATDPFDPAVEWSGYPIDTFAGLGFADLGVIPADAQSWSGIKALYR